MKIDNFKKVGATTGLVVLCFVSGFAIGKTIRKLKDERDMAKFEHVRDTFNMQMNHIISQIANEEVVLH